MALVTLPVLQACAVRAAGSRAAGTAGPSASSSAPAGSGSAAAAHRAFTAHGLVVSGDDRRGLRARIYASSPDRFRIEVRGVVGGIVAVATGEQGRARVVLPSRRSFAEGALSEDVGLSLWGLPLTGCDLAMVVRIVGGLASFRPCGPVGTEGGEGKPAGTAERPGLIVDTSVDGRELLRFGFDWSGEGEFPREARIELSGRTPAYLALTRFESIAFPDEPGADFFWEPLPPDARRVDLGASHHDPQP